MSQHKPRCESSFMSVKEWETYLCFLVNRDGEVVFSPQGAAFQGTASYAHGASVDDQNRLKQAIRETAEENRSVTDLEWSARYGEEVREYLISTDRFGTSDIEELIMVRLYRHETTKIQVSAAELKVLQGIVDDASDSQMAKELDISKTTVRRHVMRLKEKLGVTGRSRLAIEAYRLGLIHLS